MSDHKKQKTNHPLPKSTKDAPLIPEVQRDISGNKNKDSTDNEDDESTLEKVYHINPKLKERQISHVYPVIDTDLARDNVENDLSDADLQDL